jgi:O-antigen ligase
MAAAVGLPNSVISVSKVIVVVASIFVLTWPGPRGPADHAVRQLYTPFAVVLALVALAVTLWWTTVPVSEGLVALAKHGKLIMIPLLVVLLRTRREALIALAWFAGAQMIQLVGSWLLFAGVPVPWATSDVARSDFSVFSNYLGQSIMLAVFAAVCWHLRLVLAPGWRRWVACAVAALAIGNTLFVLQGRTGHVIAIVLLSLAIGWALPRRWRPAALLAPFVVAALLFAGSDTLRARADQAISETVGYLSHGDKVSSSGERLNYWHRSLQAIAERPLTGFGVGSFNREYNRLDAGRGNPGTFVVRNPHQEFLMWGVQGGIGGILVFCALLACMFRDARRGEALCARATLSVLAALVVSCMFNSTLFDAAIGDFFCVTIGLLMALGLRSAPPPSIARPAA